MVFSKIYLVALIAVAIFGCSGDDGGSTSISDSGPDGATGDAGTDLADASPDGDGGLPPLVDDTEGVVLTASRERGVAPLYVFFDTEGTELPASDRPFHDTHFSWQFGDADAGDWSETGYSKNVAYGPVAAHVFEAPGIYTVTLNTVGPDGTTRGRQVTITVDDPDAIFAGDKTRCFSNGDDFGDCPEGALRVTTSALADLDAHVAPGRRLLLKRGDSFEGSLRINTEGPGILGAFGTGDAPSITSSGGALMISGREPAASDWRVMDVSLQGVGDEAYGIDFSGTATQILILRVSMRDFTTSLSIAGSTLNYWNDNGYPGHALHDEIGIVDSDVRHAVGGGGGNLAYIVGRRLAMLGNHFEDSTEAEHVIRSPFFQKAVLSDNYFAHAASGKHVLKLHAPGFSNAGIGQGQYSEQVVISDNRLLGAAHAWTVAIGPQHGEADERYRDVIVERNHFRSGVGTQVALVLWAQEVTVRNNIADMTGGEGQLCFNAGQRGVEPPSRDLWIFNNTCYCGDANDLTGVLIDDTTASVHVVNNLIAHNPSATGRTLESGSNDDIREVSNVVTAQAQFLNSSPVAPLDFTLSPGSPAIDAGEAVPGVRLDFRHDERTAGVIDVGAFEYRE